MGKGKGVEKKEKKRQHSKDLKKRKMFWEQDSRRMGFEGVGGSLRKDKEAKKKKKETDNKELKRFGG